MPTLCALLLALLAVSPSAQDAARPPAATTRPTTGPATRPSTVAAGDWIPPGPAELRTVAERSGFKATSTYDEVVALMDQLAARAPTARRLSMGKTVEGRELPVIVFADPPVATAAEARAAAARGKVVVLLFGNIHAGEVDGKEALLMLARELALREGPHPLLKDLVIAIAPIYNADGNERFGPIERTRPGQKGPDEGAGVRHNAQDFDLNRDFVRLEAPETRALVRFLDQWDPAVVVDTHTTNGSLHRFLITYAGPKNPAGDAEVIKYGYEELLPALAEGMRARTGIDSFPYGNFEDGHARWSTFPPEARYGTNYVGLRNRLGVLSESYSYASYEDRVRGSLEFCREVLAYAQKNVREIRDLLKAADDRAARGDVGPIALRSEAKPLPAKGVALGFVEEQRDGRRVAGAPREYEVEILDWWTPTVTVDRPFAYLVPAELAHVVENLQRHGIDVEELREEVELDVTAYAVDAVHRSERAFQGHKLVRLDVTPKPESRRVPAGMFVVRTAQPLGALAAYLLEPQSEDGLATWNFFDAALAQGEAFPVLRVADEAYLLTTAARPLPEDRETGKRLTYQLLYESRNRPNFNGSPAGGHRWLDDEHYLQTRDGTTVKVHAATGRAEPFGDPEAMAGALAELATMNARTANSLARRPQRYSADYSKALIDHGNDLYVYDAAAKTAVRLTSTPAREELAEFSPDGQFVAFVRANDLHVVDVATQTERALTTGGTDDLRNGKASWVYFEEVFGRNWRAYWWSPDSTTIAFLQSDTSMVDNYALADDLPEPRGLELARYPRPGAPNPRVKLGLVPAAGGEVRWADTGGYMPDDLLITGVGWWPGSNTAWFYAQDRRQTWLDLNTIARDGGPIKRLLRDKTEAWIEPQGPPHVLEDGSFLLVSDRSGWRHLYRFDKDGQLAGPVTQGEWDVRGVELVDEKNGFAYVSGTKDSPIATNLYRARLDGSGELERLTQGPGSHSASVSPGGARFIDSWSSFKQPTQVALFAADGTRQRTLDTNPVYAIDAYAWGEAAHFQIPARDGFAMEARLTKPVDFDPSRKYPLWVTTYAGPYAPTIRDAWGGGDTYEQMLANEGILVLNVDPRPASGKGPRSAWTAYRQLGVQEARDLEDAVKWMAEHHPVDAKRVGLSGHSYGGYITAFAMTHTNAFSAGIAGAPVTDWRDYDSIYTERYMGTPQDNPEGYDASSAVKGAANLHGQLLLLHGAIDDNVHPQNTLRLARALQEAGKPFEMMIYPGMRHGIFGRHYNRLTYDFIRRTMGVAPAEESTESAAGDEQTPPSPGQAQQERRRRRGSGGGAGGGR